MKELDVTEIVKNNPKVNIDAFTKGQERIRELRAKGITSPSPSATPPVDPYSAPVGTQKHGRYLKRN